MSANEPEADLYIRSRSSFLKSTEAEGPSEECSFTTMHRSARNSGVYPSTDTNLAHRTARTRAHSDPKSDGCEHFQNRDGQPVR